MSAEAAVVRQRIRVITDALKSTSVQLAQRGFTVTEIAGAVFGLGTRMCYELERDPEKLIAMVREACEEGSD